MNRMLKLIGLIVLILFMIKSVWAEDLEIKAYVDRTTVGLNQQFNLNVEISGKEYKAAGSPQLPDMDDFAHFLGSSTSQNIQYINGKMSASRTITFHFQATAVGSFTIGAITVKTGNKEYATKPIEIKVVQSSQQSTGRSGKQKSDQQANDSSIEDALFILAVPDKKTVYKNEAVTITYKIYTRVNVTSFGLEKAPSTKGFLKEDFDIGSRPQTSREHYDGKQFTVAVIQKMSLYPLSAGNKTIEPLVANCQIKVRRKSRDIFDDFFNDPFGRTVNKVVSSNPVQVRVLPLPETGRPEGYSGIVGDFSLRSTVDKKNLSTDDAVTYTITISGEGHIGSISAPDIEFPDRFETYEPEISKDIQRKGNKITGSKTFTYVLVPREAGTYTIESVSYPVFNPRTKSYQVLKTDPVELNIVKGKNLEMSVAHSGFSKEEVDLIGKDIRFIKEEYDSLQKVGRTLFSSIYFWILLFLPLMALVSAVGFRKHLDRLHFDQAYARNRTAGRMAKKHLSEAKEKIKLEEQKEFYAAVSRALCGFVSDKFNISGAGMMSEDIKRRLIQRGVNKNVINEYIDILQICDLKRFAPSEASVEEKEQFYKKAEKILSQLAKELS